MASTTLEPIATALASVITNLSVTPAVKGYARDPGLAGLDSLPAGAVGLPTVVRTSPDEKETELGRKDWRTEWAVSLAFDLADSTYTIGQAREVVEAFIKAVDADETLGGLVDDAKVTRSEPVVIPERPRPMVVYDCTVSVLDLV